MDPHASKRVRFLLVAFAFALAPAVVQATDFDPTSGTTVNVRALPLRWCAIAGSLTADNPTTQGDPTTGLVLWRRHERPSSEIYIPQAQVTFRSGLDRAMRANQFPVIRLHFCTATNRWCAPDAPQTDPSACRAGDGCASPPKRCLFTPGTTCTTDADCGAAVPGLVGPLCVAGSVDLNSNVTDYVTECDRRWEENRGFFEAECSEPASKAGDACSQNPDCDDPAGSGNGVCRGFPMGSMPGIPAFTASLIFRGSNFVPASGWAAPTPGSAAAANQNRPAQFFAMDKSFIEFLAGVPCETGLVGHELGHTLGLGHPEAACSAPPSSVGQFCQEDKNCDDPGGSGNGVCQPTDAALQTPSATLGRNVMFQGLPCGLALENGPVTDVFSASNTRRTPMLANQLQWVKDVASNMGQWPEAYDDPPGVIVPGTNRSFVATDGLNDVPAGEGFVDISALIVAESEFGAEFTIRLNGFVPATPADALSYWVLVDLDNDPTDSAVSDLPPGVPATSFSGSDLVTLVRVAPSGGGFLLERTLWKFDGTSFVDVTNEFVSAELTRDEDARTNTSLFQYASIGFSKSERGDVSNPFRVHALTENADTGTVDVLDSGADITGDGVRDEGHFVSLGPADFPVCGVTPLLADPGDTVGIEIAGLLPNKEVRVIFGAQDVAFTQTNDAGEAATSFSIPIDAGPAARLVTAGNVGTVLTADCFAVVDELPPIILTPETARNNPGGEHTVAALVRDEEGIPLSDVLVSVSVDSGPNAGASGECFNLEAETDCTTGSDGVATFTYTGNGDTGVDGVSASFLGDTGETTVSNTTLKFWDGDCNQNDIADACDVDCGGFSGLCGGVVGCGRSLDENADGVPDECNRPPDCSNAGAEPDELWPPNHKFKDVQVGGVTDPDGDPVDTTIMAIFQDEPVDGVADGNTSPDGAGVGTSTARVRSERSGGEDGRVYRVSFSADDGQGGACTGEVAVCVPHDMRPGYACIDGGPLFDSTEMLERRDRGKKRRK